MKDQNWIKWGIGFLTSQPTKTNQNTSKKGTRRPVDGGAGRRWSAAVVGSAGQPVAGVLVAWQRGSENRGGREGGRRAEQSKAGGSFFGV